jgi:hypothetical protein
VIATIAGNGTLGFGGDGGAALSAELAYPTGVAVNSDGDAFIADNFSGLVRILTPSSPGAPAPVSVTPSSGSGLEQTFALQYADLLGATDLSSVRVWITASFNTASPSNTCLIEYVTIANQLYLYNDAGTGWLSPATLG